MISAESLLEDSMVEMKYRVGCSREFSFLKEEEATNVLWNESYCDDEWKLIWSSDDEDTFRDDTGAVGLDLLCVSEFINIAQVWIWSSARSRRRR